jgi:hypothetical protein
MTIRPGTQTRSTCAELPYVDETLKQKVLVADILLVPTEGYAERDIVFFPSGTSNFFKFIRQNAPDDMSVEAACDEQAYQELGRHDATLYLPEVIATAIAAPIFVALVTEYLKKKIWNEGAKTTLKTALTVLDQQTGRSVQLIYDGPADKFEETALKALREIQQPSKAEGKLLAPRDGDEPD